MLDLFPVLIFVLAPIIQCYSTDKNYRSSYLTIWDDKVLLGHVMTVRYADEITSCAHDCLLKPGCQSFNFGKDSNLCELNNSSSQVKDLESKNSFLHGSWITVPIIKFVFTALGAAGPTGPTSQSEYLGTILEGLVKLNNGIQEWTVPHTGIYNIEAFGASGANGTCISCSGWRLGGLGAKITGSFELKRGQKLKILVGQKGQVSRKNNEAPGGGGGGTFVTFMDNSPLVVAGGGGGAPVSIPGNPDGDPGQAGQNGTRHGGRAGLGGRLSAPELKAGTGAGIWGDGEGEDGKALSFQNGGISADVDFSKGGFGGGGYGMLLPGGGGGYSGGGVEGNFPSSGTAGGGGSINNGTSQINESGVNEGDGKVIITLMN
ncbi:uncharacterized protein LOC111330165 [Stylophora pistillata]|uniref:uncharacterized protein LOC111330165 n=1 Tax=Stylophora pistillata TaxID=50429 RepID=UPI000C04E366|nr:uncharacterized protein LOC111330165 [Stylophora pistillata]